MNNVPSQRTRTTFWLAAIAFVILLQFWWIPGQTYRASDSYSTMSDGKLGLYRVLTRLFPNVSREANVLVPTGAQTMILIDPPSDLDRNDIAGLNKFVSSGGTLVFAPGVSSDKNDYSELGFEFRKIFGRSFNNRQPTDKNADESQPTMGSESKSNNRSRRRSNNVPPTAVPPTTQRPDEIESSPAPRTTVGVTGSIIEGSRNWESNREIIPASYFDHTDLLTDSEGRVHAAAFDLGRGTVIACTSPEAFSNGAMLDPDRAELAVRLIEYADKLNHTTNRNAAGIVICEKLNDARTGDVWGILLGPALRHGSLQIVIIGLLIAWLGYEQFGPHRKYSRTGRKSLTDAADALGNLQFRSKNGAEVLARYFEYVTLNARRGSGQMASLHSHQWVAARTGLPVDEVTTQMARVEAVLKSGNESPANVANMIRWLANVQQRLSHSLPKQKQ